MYVIAAFKWSVSDHCHRRHNRVPGGSTLQGNRLSEV